MINLSKVLGVHSPFFQEGAMRVRAAPGKKSRRHKMQINRYINGKPVSGEELSRAGIVTKALENAVRDARKRAIASPEKAENSAEG